MDKSYYIDLGLVELEDQLGSVEKAHTELGSAIRQVTRGMKVDLGALGAIAGATLPSMELPSALGLNLDQLDSQFKRLQKNLVIVQETLASSQNRVLEGGGPKDFPALPRHLFTPSSIPDVDKVRSLAERVQDLAQKPLNNVNELTAYSMKESERLREVMKANKSAVSSKINQVIKNLPGNLTSGVIGALLGTVTLGYQQTTRRAAEMGEMANIFEGGVDNLFSKGSRDTVRWFANWGERGQQFWGVGRKEVQNTIKLMVDNGFTTTNMTTQFRKGLDDVGENIATLSMGLAKHYNFSTSDSMEQIVSLVRDYGMTISKSETAMVDLAAAGEKSSIGIKNFMRIVMSASDPLSRMGVSATSVGSFVEKLLGAYKDMGLDSRYAGREVEGVAVDIMNAFSHVDDKLKIAMARDIYNDPDGDAAELIIRWEDGLRRVASKEGSTFLDSMIRSFAKIAINTSTASRSGSILMIEKTLNVNNTTAARIYDYIKILEEGRELTPAGKQMQEKLRLAFEVESTQVSDLFKTKRELILGVAQMGNGLMTLLVSAVALVLTNLQGFSSLAAAPNKEARMVALAQMIAKQTTLSQNAAKALQGISSGFNTAKGAMTREFSGIFDPLIDVFNEDPLSAVPEKSVLSTLLDSLFGDVERAAGSQGKVLEAQPWDLSEVAKFHQGGSTPALGALQATTGAAVPKTAAPKKKRAPSRKSKPRSVTMLPAPIASAAPVYVDLNQISEAILQAHMAQRTETSGKMGQKW